MKDVFVSTAITSYISKETGPAFQKPEACQLYGTNVYRGEYHRSEINLETVIIEEPIWLPIYKEFSPRIQFSKCTRGHHAGQSVDIYNKDHGNQINRCLEQCQDKNNYVYDNSFYLTSDRCYCGSSSFTRSYIIQPSADLSTTCKPSNLREEQLVCGQDNTIFCKYICRTPYVLKY